MHSKLPDTGTTIFSVMSKMAEKHNAINLSQGFPNYSSSSKLFDLVKKYMEEGYNQYALMQGALPLRQAISDKIMLTNAKKLDLEKEICITAGATQAIFTAIQTLIHPGDEVIIFDPAFDLYVPSIELCGGIPVRVPLRSPMFSIDWEEVRNAITTRTKAIIINSPHNPTGAVLSGDDMLKLEKLVTSNDLYVIGDEVYEHLIFDALQHESVLKYDSLYERSIVVYSFGKTFHNTGWRVGYAIAPEKIMKEFKKIHQWVVFSVNRPVQYALAEFMHDPDTYTNLPTFYEEKRNTFLTLLKNSRFKFIPSSGTYFQLLDYSEISSKNDMAFADELVKEHQVAAIPLSPFYSAPPDQYYLRFCFAKTNDILEQAAQKLCRI